MQGKTKIQIGKNKLTPGMMQLIENSFKNRSNLKISLLKNTGHDKESTKDMAEHIVERLGKNYTYRIIGFTISIKKWKKDKR